MVPPKSVEPSSVSPVHGWQLYDRFWVKTSIPKMELDKTGSDVAAVLQPLEGVATPVQSMN